MKCLEAMIMMNLILFYLKSLIKINNNDNINRI